MPLIKLIQRLSPLLVCASLLGCSLASHETRSDSKLTATMTMTMVQVLIDNEAGVDGLDNPRAVKISPDGTHAAVVSGDDNSMAIFDIDDDFTLTFNRVFKNNIYGVTGLEGASQLAFLPSGNKMFTVSFYDSALVVFDRGEEHQYRFKRRLSDGLSIERIFKDTEPLGALDTLGLLGAWDLVASGDGQQLYIASYKSNALSVFDVSGDDLVFNRFEGEEPGLGGAVGLDLSGDNTLLAVTGFDEHMLTLYNRTMDGELELSQILRGGDTGIPYLVNPQVVKFSPDGHFIYVACSGSDAIVVLNRIEAVSGSGTRKGEDAAKYALFQTLTNDELGGGLKGAGSLAISSDGSRLYAAGEADSGVLVLRKENDGRLSLESKLFDTELVNKGLPAGDNKDINVLVGVSSLQLSKDGQYLLVTSAKQDSLYVLKLKASVSK
ncbi:beta-propeller fold lactonase family protein [Shewanella canadensis]|nr:beta-propeller fold lactonase family protein [Shewanella canadensis]